MQRSPGHKSCSRRYNRPQAGGAKLAPMEPSSAGEIVDLRGSEVRWAFLDRDGTLNVKAPAGEYVTSPAELELLPGAASAVRALNEAGIWVGVVTNQRGVALGRMSLADVDAVNGRLGQLLADQGAFVNDIYVCPHETGSCDCRKPAPGLLLQARERHPELDWERAAIFGDSLSDVLAGRHLGLLTVLIQPSDEARTERPNPADHTVPDLLSGVTLLSPPLNGAGASAGGV
jgi:D-glycero-D-manno-heptose 1,7-bisphosphate phosphatase